jgi:hypothetical protein
MFILRSGVSYFMAYVQAQEVNPLTGQDEHETLETLFRNVDSSFDRRHRGFDIVFRGLFCSRGGFAQENSSLRILKTVRRR